MTRERSSGPPQSLLEVALERGPEAPTLQQQLHTRLRQAILSGTLPRGARLPSSRLLAQRLDVGRNTVTNVYEQLTAEGFLLPDRQGTSVIRLALPQKTARPSAPMVLSARLGSIPLGKPRNSYPLTLRPGVPDLTQFPLAAWRRSLDRVLKTAGPAALGHGEPFGEPKLRESVAHYLGISRGVRCHADQVVITSSAQEAISLCVRLFTNPGDTAWVEDPGYRGAQIAMFEGGLNVVPKRIDAEGLVVADNDWSPRPPRLIYTTPSHQYPLGSVLSASRRLALLGAAKRSGAWIIEDDYDSEFRHSGKPIRAMQGMLEDAPVLYVGTFSKTMFPALRIGFIVLPAEVVEKAGRIVSAILPSGQLQSQLALADFIECGQFSRHLGRMRRLYRERQLVLREELTRHFKFPHAIEGGQCGMHLTVRIPPEIPDGKVASGAAEYGLGPFPLSSFALRPTTESNGLVLGYGNASVDLMPSLARNLAKVVRSVQKQA